MSNEEFLHAELTGKIIGCCIEVIRELGSGFLENVYKNALYIVMVEKGLNVLTEKTFEIDFRGHKIGRYNADLVVEGLVIVELKCCPMLIPEHQAQLINYLKAADIEIGLLVNFGNQKLEYKRLHHPDHFVSNEEKLPFLLSTDV
ncbi:MAG TPA: GxxExxY protein [Rhabdochlamydiaceae bacterium]|nr:GxxExxY protein [Rhabdochlamydiaceae bacterium]